MKNCPYCAESIQDTALKCRYCGEFLEQIMPQHIEYEPTPEEHRKWAEIRRLQRIASGVPTKADNLRKTKGLLSLIIILLILFYAYTWNKNHAQSTQAVPVESKITFEELNVLFGPISPLPKEEQKTLFAKYQGKRVTWKGNLAYVNNGEVDELFITLQHPSTLPTAGVELRFRDINRDQITDLRTGQTISYSGRLIDYDNKAQFFLLRDGRIILAQ